MTSSDVAAWVQAVGSILAIVAGFGVAAYQMHHAESTRRLEQRELDDAARAAMGEAVSFIRHLSGEMAALDDSAAFDPEPFRVGLGRHRAAVEHFLTRPLLDGHLIGNLGQVMQSLLLLEEPLTKYDGSGGAWSNCSSAAKRAFTYAQG